VIVATDYVAVLRRKRETVWSELEEMRDESRHLGDRIQLKEAQLRNLDELLALEQPPTKRDASNEALPGVGRSFLDAAADLLLREGSGLHYQELLTRLKQLGVHVPGRDPAANLITHLSRDPRFIRTGRGEYGLEGRDHAAPVARTKRVRAARQPRARSGR
jgi:hypothetical protein